MKYEITSKKEFQIEAAKALLADGQPHSYAEIVQHIRSQAEGTVLEGRIDYGNVWYSLRSMMEEPGSHYQKAGWGAYQKDPPQRITAEPAQDVKDGQSEIYQIMDQAVELLERFESYSSRVQGELNLTSGQETFSAIRQQIMQNLDGTVTGLSCWAAELEDLQETPAQRETRSEASEQTRADSISLSM